MIEVRNLTIRHSARTVLDTVALDIHPGRVTAIAGPNGSGKSTLLRALAGELRYHGSILLAGKELSGYRPLDLAVRRGVLPQFSQAAFPFDVAEVVALGLGSSRRGTDAPARPVAEALNRVGLQGYEDRNYQALSGGEQQRVQLARVLCQVPHPVGPDGPCWLLLDEPVSSLDIHHQIGIMRLARDFARAGGGVLAVMHDLNLTALFSDDLVFIRAGRVVAAGAVDETMTDARLEEVFSCPLKVNRVPASKVPFVLAHTAAE